MPPHTAASRDARKWKKAARARRNRSFSSLPARVGQVLSGQASPVAEARQEGEAVNEQEAESSSAPATSAKSPASHGQIPSGAKAESSSAPAAFDESPAPYDQISSSAAALMHLQQCYETSEEEDEDSSLSSLALSEKEAECSSTSSFALSEEEAEGSSTSAEDYPTVSDKSRSKKRKGKSMRREGKRKRMSGSGGQGRRFPPPKKIKLRQSLVDRHWPMVPCKACLAKGVPCTPPSADGHGEKCQACTAEGVRCSHRWVLQVTGEMLADLEECLYIDVESAEFLTAERKALSKFSEARNEGLKEAREEARGDSSNKARDEVHDRILNEACSKARNEARNEALDEALKIKDSLAEVLNESGKLNEKLDKALKLNEALNETCKDISALNKRLAEAFNEICHAAEELRK